MHRYYFFSFFVKSCHDGQLNILKGNIIKIHEFIFIFQDGDGTIDTKELGAVMRSLGSFPDDEEIEEMVC